MSIKYYGANGIDKYVIETFFINKTNGYFVDIGAYDGITYSNSKTLEDLGWEGICFEPFPDIFDLLKKNRKCKLVNKALSDTEGKLEFFSIKGHAVMLSGLVKDYPQEHINRINREIEEFNDDFNYIEVDCSIFSKEVNNKNIDLLSIDTEGAELSIIKTINFNQYNINIVILEYNYNNQELINLLYANNFEIVNHIGCDIVLKNKNYVY